MALRYPDTVPRLTDGVVTLRAMREDDLPAVVEQSQDPETVRWTTVPTPYGPSDAAAFLEVVRAGWQDGSRSTWAIEHDGHFAGLISHRPRGPGRVEVSFAAHPKQRGQGLVTRAVRLVSEHAFSHEGAEVVLWHAHVGNFGSRKVAWRNGFQIGGPIRRTHEQRGTLVDAWAGSLVKGDPLEPAHSWHVPVTLQGDGVRLRAFRARDAAAMPEELDDAAAASMAGATPTRAQFDDWLLARTVNAAEGDSVIWAITDPATDAVLGGLQIFQLGNPMNPGSGMVGFWLLPSTRDGDALGKALEPAIAHAFAAEHAGGLGLRRLEAGCAVNDIASARVLRRAGFHEIGTERDALPVARGAPSSSLLLDLLATDDRAEQRVDVLAVPVLETEHLRLRPWRDTDVPRADEGPDAASLRFMRMNAQPDTAGYPQWLQRKRAQLEEGDNVDWCIAEKETDHALGNVTLFRMGPLRGRFQGEVGYWLHPTGRGRGLAAEALEPVIAHAFTPVVKGGLGLTRLYAGTDRDNAASQATLERVGFRQWGTDRQAYRRSSGELTNGAYFELLATDDRTDRRARPRAPLAEVTLEGERVRLRAWQDGDAHRVAEASREARTRHWLAALPSPYTDEDAATYVSRCHHHARAGSGLNLAVADPDDDRCIGSVAVTNLDSDDQTVGEIGYWSHPDARGQGVMTEAVGRLVRHAFAPREDGGLGLRRLVLHAAAGNAASQHVAAANGFVRTGLQRQAEHLGDGTYDDLVDFDLLASQWSAH